MLKEYYEIVDEARPLSWFFLLHHETKQASKLLSDPSSKLLHNQRLKNEIM